MIKAPPARPSGHFIMETARNGTVLDVVISGDLTRESAHHVEDIVTHLACSLDWVLIDLSGVSSIASEGVDALIRSSDAIEGRGAHVVLKGVPDQAMLLLEASGAGARFEHVGRAIAVPSIHDRSGSL